MRRAPGPQSLDGGGGDGHGDVPRDGHGTGYRHVGRRDRDGRRGAPAGGHVFVEWVVEQLVVADHRGQHCLRLGHQGGVGA